MKRFRYPLERVLELRRHTEQEWELKLAEATAVVVGLEQQLQEIGTKKVQASLSRTQAGTDTGYLYQYSLYQNRLDQAAEKVMEQMVQAEAQRDKVREGYLEASKARKALDKLKEKQSEVFYKEQLKEEAKAQDEMATTRAIRRAERRD